MKITKIKNATKLIKSKYPFRDGWIEFQRKQKEKLKQLLRVNKIKGSLLRK